MQLERLQGGQTLIVAAPLDEVDDTLHQLLVVEVVVALSVLAAILVLGLWLVRVGLRPLGRIEVTAADDRRRRSLPSGSRTTTPRRRSAGSVGR